MRLSARLFQYAFLLLLTIAAIVVVLDVVYGTQSSWWVYLIKAFSPLLCIVFCGITAIRIAIPKLRMGRLETLVALVIFVALCAPTARHIRTRYPQASRLISPRIEESFISIVDLNVLGDRYLSDQSIAQITKANADVVTLQEVNPELAASAQQRLAKLYPCQILIPAEGTSGMGLLSRFSCRQIRDAIDGDWIGPPIVAEISPPNRRPFIVANIHALAPHMPTPAEGQENILSRLSRTVRSREESLENLLRLLAGFEDRAVIIAGDLNATIRNRAYALIRNNAYKDGWLTLHDQTNGGTWPFPEFFGTRLLSWILRIDYIFYSDLLSPVCGETIASDMGSDHKGLFFVFRELSEVHS